ncbi:hypothetical protein OG426_22905 [Streptomyces canus]|uniref:hypothetical protein n=1 Tax=Streptomyces canus TaxID=58343 RepID=UPI002254784F|nr:hypothetical protein [Streptomyces canus]MCX4859661.1 hypothetical protein [Streptomyces canus]WSW35117.1 hypothetical protein OG426_22905 [Streptomyces canus]
MLVGHEQWLRRDDFVAEFIEVVPALTDGTPMAFVDWSRVAARLKRGRLACSSGESQVLRLCASLAEGVPVDLADALTSLDAPTVVLVADAVLRAGGCAEAALSARDGGAR